MADKNSLTGLPKNTKAAISYLLGPITGVLMLMLDKDPFVKFHALQSTVVFGFLFVLQLLLTATLVLVFIVPFVNVLGFLLWLVLIYKAWKGEEYEVPYLGKFARKYLKKV